MRGYVYEGGAGGMIVLGVSLHLTETTAAAYLAFERISAELYCDLVGR